MNHREAPAADAVRFVKWPYSLDVLYVIDCERDIGGIGVCREFMAGELV